MEYTCLWLRKCRLYVCTCFVTYLERCLLNDTWWATVLRCPSNGWQDPTHQNPAPEVAIIHHRLDRGSRNEPVPVSRSFAASRRPAAHPKTKAPTSATGSAQKSPASKSTGPSTAQAPARAREQLYAPFVAVAVAVAVPHTRNIAVHCSHALIRRIAETGKNKREKF